MWQRRLGLDIDVPDDFGNWLAGFMDADGTFLIQGREKQRTIACTCAIVQRDDNDAILYKIQEVLGVGHIRPLTREKQRERGMTNAKDALRWRVGAIGDIIHVIIPLFEKYSLRGKKKRDFELWARAARIIQIGGHLTKAGHKEVLRLKQEMEKGRRYNG
jgi:hypothetical protein